MKTIIKVTVELVEDMHAGSGLGRLGQIDALHARDAQGMPVIRASTLRGIVRDTAEEWIRLLKKIGNDGEEHRSRLSRLLGISASDVDGEKRAEAIFTALTLKDKNLQPFLVWSSTARRHGSRCPQEGSLRQIEHARAGLKFSGTVTVPTPDDAQWLESCLKRVTALGGRRTRGSGEIKIHLQRHTPSVPVVQDAPSTGSVLRLLIKAVEPLNLARTGVAGNLIPTERHLPGSTVRGALLNWLASSGDDAADLAARLGRHEQFLSSPGFFLPEQLRVNWTTATVMPLPLSLQSSTATTSTDIPWWAVDDQAGDRHQIHDLASGAPAPGRRWKRIREEGSLVVFADGASPVMAFPAIGVLMRNQVPSSRRRNDDSDSPQDDGLFTEEVLIEGQLFVAEFHVPSEERMALAKALHLLTGGNETDRSMLRLGRGGRPVVVVDHSWITPSLPPVEPNLSSGSFTITLCSNLIARTPWLGYATHLKPAILGELLALAGKPVDQVDQLQLERSWTDSVAVSGFNRATRRLRAPAWAIRMGSVFKFTGPAAVVDSVRKALAGLPAIGERTNEGHGQFVVDLGIHSGPQMPQMQRCQPPVVEVSWREAILEKVRAFVDNNQQIGKSISRSQWQWLRHQASATGHNSSIDDAIWKPLGFHVATRAGGNTWGNMLPVLKSETNRLNPPEHARYFLERVGAAFAAIAPRRTTNDAV